jgi:transposase
MIHCQDDAFSAALQQQRLMQAQKVLGETVVRHLLCFALYLLGVDRSSVADMMDLPAGTVRSIVRAVLHHGLPALEDRRRSASAFLPPQQRALKINVHSRDRKVCVDIDTMGSIEIPGKNSLQTRVVLLTMLNQGLVSTQEVSKLLGLSRAHTLSLAHRLHTEDVPALIDKREGQKQEYRFTAEVKAELIQQFVLDIVAGGRASGKLLAEHLRERCELVLSERSIRDQLGKLGLSRIKKSLPELLKGLKKTP